MELSRYAKELDPLAKLRYKTKIEYFKKDPYLLKYDKENLPKNVKFCAIFNYLMQSKSVYTGNDCNNNKSITKAQQF